MTLIGWNHASPGSQVEGTCVNHNGLQIQLQHRFSRRQRQSNNLHSSNYFIFLFFLFFLLPITSLNSELFMFEVFT